MLGFALLYPTYETRGNIILNDTISFVNDLPDDPLEALQEVTDRVVNDFSEFSAESVSMWPDYIGSYIEAFAYANVSCDINNISIIIPMLQGLKHEQLSNIGAFFMNLCPLLNEAISCQALERHKERFSNSLGNGFVYEFPDEDFDRIQELINVLRDEIKDCDLLEEEHRVRLLKKLEKLQGEFHKKMSNLDMFFGIMLDSSVVLGKVGENIKPLTDRMREIGEIALKIFCKSEGIPTNISLEPLQSLKLGDGSGNEDENS